MAFDNKYQNYGVIKIESNRVNLFESSQNYLTLNTGGETPLSAHWAGEAVIVNLANGKVRRYTTQQSYVAH